MIGLIRYLHKVHWAVVAYGSLLTVMAALGSRKFNMVLLPIYTAFISLMTLMYREIGIGRLNLTPFWSYRKFLSNPYLRMEIVNNIWLFVPLGAIMYKLVPRRNVVIMPLLISIVIEVTQYMLDVGLCELDDVISNGLGGLIGVLACRGIFIIWKNYRKQHKKK